MYEITVRSVFAAAHAIRLPGGAMEPVHGHNWEVAVTVASDRLDEIETVMDFHKLEAVVEQIVGPWRNGSLNDVEPFAGGDVNPSAERVAWWIGKQAAEQLPGHVNLVSVAVGEAPGCTAVYRPSVVKG